MSDDRLVFHIEGGAVFGGKTLTAWSSDLGDAKAEAIDHFDLNPRRGFWLFRHTVGPDGEGNLYHHHYWQGKIG
jgi:hypothetical protein